MTTKLWSAVRFGIDQGALFLAAAAMIDGALALAFTIVFARVLGPAEYASLAALISLFLTVSIIGTALQATAARLVSSQVPRPTLDVHGSSKAWTLRLTMAAAVGLLLLSQTRHILASASGINQDWAIALIIPAAVLDLAISAQRGVLLGLGRYRLVALSLIFVPGAWLLLGGALAVCGFGLTGVVFGIALSQVVTVLAMWARLETLRGRAGELPRLPLRSLVRSGFGPIAALGLFATLHNLDVLVVRIRVQDDELASSYAVAAVGAKAILWVAAGLSMYLVPEVARKRIEGESSAPILRQSVALLLAAALPTIAALYMASGAIIDFVFGSGFGPAAELMPLLSVAMTLLAIAYLAMQLLVARHRYAFLPLLGAAAAAEPLLIAAFAPNLRAIALTIGVLAFALALGIGGAASIEAAPRLRR